jgi:hypothetical protein
MKLLRMLITRILPALVLLAAACSAQRLPAVSPTQTSDRQASLPPAMKIVHEQRLGAPPNANHPPADFGKAIALGDGVLAVGAPSISGGPEFSAPGSVSIYRRGADGWVEEARLIASDQDDGFQYAQNFGAAIAMQDHFLFVGAPNTDDRQAGDNCGAVYVFEDGPDGWSEIATLKSPEAAANVKFGSRVVAQGGHLGVLEGDAYLAKHLRLFQGQADDWHQTALIEVPVPESQMGGIVSFDLYGDMLVVGSVAFEGEAMDARISGKVLIYRFDGATWLPDTGLPEDVFGLQLALDGDGKLAERLVVASQFSALNGFNSGAVFVFQRSAEGWKLEETLGSPDGGQAVSWGSGYGGSVALHGDLLLAGGPGFSEDSNWDGVAYLYQRSEGRWVDQLRLHHSEDGGFGDFFGSQVEIFERTLLISAPDEFGNAVYVFEVGPR